VKHTEERLRGMIRAELDLIQKEKIKEIANRIMEEVCKDALFEVRFTDSVPAPSEVDVAIAAKKKAKKEMKFGPSYVFRNPLLQDLRLLIEEELNVGHVLKKRPAPEKKETKKKETNSASSNLRLGGA